jgi:cation transport ATPase
VEARVGRDTVLVGNSSFMKESGIDTLALEDVERSLAASGHTVILVARNGSLRGIIAAKDAVRPEADGALTIGIMANSSRLLSRGMDGPE